MENLISNIIHANTALKSLHPVCKRYMDISTGYTTRNGYCDLKVTNVDADYIYFDVFMDADRETESRKISLDYYYYPEESFKKLQDHTDKIKLSKEKEWNFYFNAINEQIGKTLQEEEHSCFIRFVKTGDGLNYGADMSVRLVSDRYRYQDYFVMDRKRICYHFYKAVEVWRFIDWLVNKLKENPLCFAIKVGDCTRYHCPPFPDC